MTLAIGDRVPVFDTQLFGCSFTDAGQRFPNSAKSGWWTIEKLDGTTVRLRKDAEKFECDLQFLRAVLVANRESVAHGAVP